MAITTQIQEDNIYFEEAVFDFVDVNHATLEEQALLMGLLQAF